MTHMKIAGLQKISMVDFPGHVCATIFTQGCNFRCGFCHNRDLITTDADFQFSQEEMFGYFNSRKKMLEAVCITGGEPTLWPDLPELIRKIKDAGLKVKLDTNGSRPQMVRDLLGEGLLDYIAMDVKTSFGKYPLLNIPDNTEEALAETIRAMISSDIEYEFRTTCVPGIVAVDDIYSIGKAIKGARRHCLQQFRPSGNVVEEKYSDLKPYTKEKLKEMRSISERFVEEAVIRGI